MREQATLLHRTVSHHGHAMGGQPRQQVALGAAPRQVVEYLVGLAGSAARFGKLVHVVRIEVADAPSQDLTRVHESVHRLDGLAQRYAVTPVEEV